MMRRPRLPNDPTALGLAAAVLFALVGIATSLHFGDGLSTQARAEWEGRAEQEVRRLTRSLHASLEHVEENIRNVAALFASSDEVTQPEFQAFSDAAESWNYEVRLSDIAFGRCGDIGEKRPRRPCRIVRTTGGDGLLPLGTRPAYGPEYTRSILAALQTDREVSFSDPFRVDGRHFLLVLRSAENAGRPGLVMGLVDLARLFENFEAEIPVGLDLRVRHQGASSYVDAPAANFYGRRGRPDTVEAVFQIDPAWDKIRWTLVWEVAPNYDGGPATATGRWVALAGSALSGLAGLVMAILIRQNAIVRDRVRERTRDLSRARAEAEAANRAKSMFLANISHELRTPLNAIIGFSEMIKERTFGPVGDPRYQEYADDIHASGNHLLALVNDVLDISRIDADQIKLNPEPTALRGLIDGAVRQLQGQAERRGIAIQTVPPPDHLGVVVDPVRVRQALINVIGNAIKFAPEGSSVRVAAALGAGGAVALTVTDTGPGIADADMRKALEPFGQIDAGLNRRHEGAGLGLPLAKRLVEVHGGHLTLDSQLGRGTAVTIELPASCVVAEAGDARCTA